MPFLATIPGAILGGSAIAAGSGLIGDAMNGGQPNVSNTFTPGPDYQQGQTAQNDWLNQLTQDQNDPTGNFGGISPDWNDIWQQTQEQVNNYFNGTATSPGVNDQIKASFAQRGMSGDPASSYLLSASGANQAQDLGDLSAQQNIAQQQFAQTAKQNWFTNMNNFNSSTANEQGNWGGQVIAPTEGQQVANTVGAAGSGVAQLGIQQQNANTQSSMLNSFLYPNGSPAGMSFAPGVASSTSSTAPFNLGAFQTY